MSIILRTNMCELKPTNSNELQIEFVDEENISNNEKGGNKKKLKEILKRVYIGIYEDSKNILLLKNTGITRISKKIKKYFRKCCILLFPLYMVIQV